MKLSIIILFNLVLFYSCSKDKNEIVNKQQEIRDIKKDELKHKVPNQKSNKLSDHHIASHTKRKISLEDKIKFSFNKNLPTSIGHDYTKKIIIKTEDPGFEFDDYVDQNFLNNEASSNTDEKKKPDHNQGTLKFKAYQTSDKEITIEFYEALLPSKEFTITELITGNNWNFDIETESYDYEVSYNNLKLTKDTFQASGVLEFNLKSDIETIKKIITAKHTSKAIPIDITTKNNKKFYFKTKEIPRSFQKKETITFKIESSKIGIEDDYFYGDKLGKSIDIPPQVSFKITNIIVKDKEVEIIFSSDLSEDQDIKGLAYIKETKIKVKKDKNKIRIYTKKPLKKGKYYSLVLKSDILAKNGAKLLVDDERFIISEKLKPYVKLTSKATILPSSENSTLPVSFESASIDSVYVTAFRVKNKNIPYFLQENSLSQKSSLLNFGRYMWRKKIKINGQRKDLVEKKKRFIDLAPLFKEEENALYNITIEASIENSIYECSKKDAPTISNNHPPNREEWKDDTYSGWDGIETYKKSYDYGERNNPCTESYYIYYGKSPTSKFNVKSSQNFFKTDIGILAKLNPGNALVGAAHKISTGEIIKDAEVEVYNYQNDKIGQTKVDTSGKFRINLDKKPFYLKIKSNEDVSYLKLNKGSALPLSHFPVNGTKSNNGVKGYIFGERGIWRPGDDIYLTFSIYDKESIIPKDYPFNLELHDPKGKKIAETKPIQKSGNLYLYKLRTNKDDPTGNYIAKVKFGNLEFNKKLKIETFVPNRMIITLDYEDELIKASTPKVEMKISAEWLHGGAASNLKYEVHGIYSPKKTTFKINNDYTFDDITRSGNFLNAINNLSTDERILTTGNLTDAGNAFFDFKYKSEHHSPGFVKATFNTKVFEESGAFSTSTVKKTISPFNAYVGIKTPKGDQKRNMLLTDTKHTINFSVLSPEGEPIDTDQIDVALYKISWKYWYDKSEDDFSNFLTSSSKNKLKEETLQVNSGKAQTEIEIKYPDWGRYLIRGCSKKSNHCSSKILLIDWPGWAGRSTEGTGLGATSLQFSSDKGEYSIGEDAQIYLPSAENSRAFVSIEKSDKVLDSFWIDTTKGDNKFNLKIKEEFFPNFYINISLIQPHQNKVNDSPIRLYGVIPIGVKDENRQINLSINSPKQVKPGETFEFSINDGLGKDFDYIVAIVDEGILNVTNFKTPNLYDEFFKKESLEVRTFDLYDNVIGSFGGKLESLLSIGGDGFEELQPKNEDKRRFPPVVKILGPFNSIRNGLKHSTSISNYMGAVRIMAIAANDKSFGSGHKLVKVKNSIVPMMALPATGATEDEIKIPVTIFNTEPELQKINVKLIESNDFKILGDKAYEIEIASNRDKTVYFKVKLNSTESKVKFQITASGKETIDLKTYLDVNHPIPSGSEVENFTISRKGSKSFILDTNYINGSKSVSIELSSVPPFGFTNILESLISYPHGCLEQTVSKIFPQIYLKDLKKLSQIELDETRNNVIAGINKIERHRSIDGGFSYWPGNNSHYWATIYATHFLIEALVKGYNVNNDMTEKALKYLNDKVEQYDFNTSSDYESVVTQAYALYVLSHGAKPNIGAMNRLKEKILDSHDLAIVMLAATYGKIQQKNVMEELFNLSTKKYNAKRDYDRTFGSSIRNMAMALSTLAPFENLEDENEKLSNLLIGNIKNEKDYTTQEKSWIVLAMANYFKISERNKIDATVKGLTNETIKIDQKESLFNVSKSEKNKEIDFEGQKVTVQNNSSKKLYLNVIKRGVPQKGSEKEISNGLKLEIEYIKEDKITSILGKKFKRGDNLTQVVRVINQKNKSLKNVALTHIFPTGVRIENNRLNTGDASSRDFDYQDIRANKVYTYFDIGPNQLKTFKITFTNEFSGLYYFPGPTVEVMYEPSIKARTTGNWFKIE